MAKILNINRVSAANLCVIDTKKKIKHKTKLIPTVEDFPKCTLLKTRGFPSSVSMCAELPGWLLNQDALGCKLRKPNLNEGNEDLLQRP